MSTVKNPQDFTDDEIEESLRYAANKLGFVEGLESSSGRPSNLFSPGTTYSLHYPRAHGRGPGFRGKSAVFQAALALQLCVNNSVGSSSMKATA